MKRHKIIWYYILTFICTVVFGGTAGALCDISVPEQYAISLMMTQMSPMIGLILLCLFCKDWSGFKQIKINPFKDKNNIICCLLSLLIPFAIILSSSVILSVFGNKYVSNGYNAKEIVIIFIASLIGCIGEEIGWRGFLFPEFNKKYSMLMSGIFTGILWGAWHFGKISLYGIIGYLLFVLMITEFSVIMAWIYSKTNGNLTAMFIFHLSINMSSVLLLTQREGILFYIIGIILSAVVIALCLKDFFAMKINADKSKGNDIL